MKVSTTGELMPLEQTGTAQIKHSTFSQMYRILEEEAGACERERALRVVLALFLKFCAISGSWESADLFPPP